MIRKIKQVDAAEIERILNKIPIFSGTEVKVGMELVNIAASDIEQTDYNIFVYEEEKKIYGYYCAGRRPLTDAVYDLYWIAVDPESKKKGIGRELLQHAENFVLEKQGRWLLAETSSKQSYEKTRNFYLRNNFSVIAQINDFYTVGDSLIIFGKFFNK
ncbi:MAG: GNAT family N-acetyltransferase [Ignavibacteriaceae bacterium]